MLSSHDNGKSTGFTVLIPARLASQRLPGKPLVDIHGMPMVVRVARQAHQSSAVRTVVAADSQAIVDACAAHGVEAVLTRADHASGSDRLAEACDLLGLNDDSMVVNVQGDEPLILPGLINAVADLLAARNDCAMGTAAHTIDTAADWLNPNVVKVVLDARHNALYFSRAPIPAARDFGPNGWWSQAISAASNALPRPLRHIGIYSYRAGFLRQFPQLATSPLERLEMLEQLRALWHGFRIAVHLAAAAPGPGVDTPEDLARVRGMLAAPMARA